MGFLIGLNFTQSGPSATWTEANLGNDVTGSINEISSTAVSVTAAGTSDPDNGTIAYQTVSSGDIQFICKVPAEYLNTVENWTFFGLQLREALTGAPVVMQLCSGNAEYGVAQGNKAKHRLTTSGSFVAYATGLTSMKRPKYLAITYNATANEVKYWESIDGVANNYQQIGATVSITLAYPLYVSLYGLSQDNAIPATAALSNCTIGSSITISQAAPPGARNLRGQMTWETGKIQANGYLLDGLYTDGTYMQGLVYDGSPRVITNITKSSTPVATYTGTLLVEGDGITLGSTGGYPEIRGRLFRVRNPTSTTFDVYQDGDDTGFNVTNTTEGNTRTNTSGYGTWGGNINAQGYTGINTGAGMPTYPTAGPNIAIIQTTTTPPTNAVGAANAVVPLLGDYFLASRINYWEPHDVITGNSDLNKPRWSANNGNGQEFFPGEDEWVSVSIFLPSNYDHENGYTGNLSRMQVFLAAELPAQSGSNIFEIHLAGNGAGVDQWEMDTTPLDDIVLGSVSGDIDLWTTFVINLKSDPTNGYLHVWKSTGPDLGGGERAMALVYTVTGNVGQPLATSYHYWWRQYKYGWHSFQYTIDSTMVWLGWDEMRFGGVNEGTGFSDVHPFQQSAP